MPLIKKYIMEKCLFTFKCPIYCFCVKADVTSEKPK